MASTVKGVINKGDRNGTDAITLIHYQSLNFRNWN